MKTERLTKAAAGLVAVIFVVSFGYYFPRFCPVLHEGIQPMNTMPFNTLGPLVDPVRAEKVQVVLRVKLIRFLGADKYGEDEAEVLTVLKNTSGETIGKTVRIATYSYKKSLPNGKSTVYLEPYSPKQGLWLLLGRDAEIGTSHVSSR